MEEKITWWGKGQYKSGFTEGKCPNCGKRTFSKGKVSKHRCKS
jgi:tRNA(Ile2) C34 agmatinyltransferase TiaS